MKYEKLSRDDITLIGSIKRYFNNKYNNIACIIFAEDKDGNVYTSSLGEGITKDETIELAQAWIEKEKI